MTRSQLEHIILVAGSIANAGEIVVIGSQAVLGQFPNAPSELLISREADVYPLQFPERSDLIDGTIGEGSPFERTYGYFAHGVGPETAVLPGGWEARLVTITNENTQFVRGLCLEVHDLEISKLVAGREKDIDFAVALHRHSMIDVEVLRSRLAATRLDSILRTLVEGRIERCTRF